MPYGQEAKEEMLKIVAGKCLKVLVFTEDRYGRCVGDIYCNGIFVQVISKRKPSALSSEYENMQVTNEHFI